MKTNRILLCCSVLFLLLSMEPLHAQNGTQALDKVVGKFQQSNGISATFTLTVFNTLNEPVEKQNGTIKLSGNKFYWNTTSMTVWYDGLQQWAYVKATEEVNLTEPTTEEIATVNPYILINNYKKDFYIKTLKSKSSKESIAELTPKKKGTNIDHIIIMINTTTWNPSSFKLYYSDRTYSIINLSKYATDQNFPDSTFVFNKKQYPKAELIDLR